MFEVFFMNSFKLFDFNPNNSSEIKKPECKVLYLSS